MDFVRFLVLGGGGFQKIVFNQGGNPGFSRKVESPNFGLIGQNLISLFSHQKCVRREYFRTCLSRCALSQYRFSFLNPTWRQKHSLGPWLHFQPLKKVWNCLILLYFYCRHESCCITWFCRLIGLLYFSKISWWTRSTCSDRFYHGE